MNCPWHIKYLGYLILKDFSNAWMVMWEWIWAGIAWHNTVYYITSWLSVDILDSKFTKDSKVTSFKLTSLQLYNRIRLPHYKLTICQLFYYFNFVRFIMWNTNWVIKLALLMNFEVQKFQEDSNFEFVHQTCVSR